MKKKKKRKTELAERVAIDEDIVEDLVLSSDEEDRSLSDTLSDEDEEERKPAPLKPESKKQKRFTHPSKKNVKSQAKKSRKRESIN